MNGRSIRTFLSANGSEGFLSLYPQFLKGLDQYVIKGGPGSGKSSMMKTIAKEAIHNGYFTEYIYCSSDADSLDGVYIPALNTTICDGTAPHTSDPNYPGACGQIINVSDCWDEKRLKKSKNEIIRLSTEISECYIKVYGYLKAAGAVYADRKQICQKYFNQPKADTFVSSFIKRHIPQNTTGESPPGKVHDRFLSSVAPQGFVTFRDTIYTMADYVYTIQDKYGIGSYLVGKIAQAAIDEGYDTYRFFNPLAPDEIIHIAIPQLNFAIVCSDKQTPFEPQNTRRIKTDRFISDEIYMALNKIRYAGKIISMSQEQALEFLKYAKALHDYLEDLYIAAMDFEKLNRLTASAMTKIFIK